MPIFNGNIGRIIVVPTPIASILSNLEQSKRAKQQFQILEGGDPSLYLANIVETEIAVVMTMIAVGGRSFIKWDGSLGLSDNNATNK